jgi:hypothetical protein
MVVASTAIVRPGDTLIVAVGHTLTRKQADEIKDMIKARLAGIEVVILGQVSGIAAYRPEEIVTP